MTKIKLVAIDVDGTLLDSKRRLTLNVEKTIKKALSKGIKIVLCTGRPAAGTRHIQKRLGLDDRDDQYIVSFGGSQVVTTNGKILAETPLTYQQYSSLEMLARQKDLHFHALSQDRIYTANRDIGRYTVNESLLDDLPISYRTPEEMKSIKIMKAMFIDEPDVLDQAMEDKKPFDALKSDLVFAKSAPYYLEVNAKEVNKGVALEQLCQILQLTPQNVAAIGDQENDLSMIRFSGYGVAMGNAIPEVKAQANVVTDDNDHDGVATILEKILAESL